MFLIFFIVIILLYMVGLGFIVDLLIIDQYPGQDVISVFNGFILFYLLGDLLMRFYLQDVPALEVQRLDRLGSRRPGAIARNLKLTTLFTS
ncbi:MAG: DUF5687 family protein, partial [Bacteroidota bacterium]